MERRRGRRRGAGGDRFVPPVKPHPRVLIVDGDPVIGRMLRILLEGERYRVLWSRSGEDALAKGIQIEPDAIILELDLPDGDGLEVLAALREWSASPVLILSGRSNVSDVVRALDAGANDFLAKPFAPVELAARLRVLLRSEPPMSDGPLLVGGGLRIDLATREMTVNGSLLGLTETEEAVLYVLARHAGKLVAPARLTRAVWGVDAAVKTKDLQVHVAHLRRKLERHGGRGLIRGDGSIGYSLSLAADHERSALKDTL
jgi:two-component system KDP operon response regulator KdpE